MYELHCTICDRLMPRDEVEIENGIIPLVVYCKDVEGCWQAFANSVHQHMLFGLYRAVPALARSFADSRRGIVDGWRRSALELAS